MKPRHRLRAPADFRRVVRGGRSVAGPGFVLYHLPKDGHEPSRFGFSVDRRVGGAVVRNRVRRLLREACRSLANRLAYPVDVVIVAREPAARWDLENLQRNLDDASARAGLTDPLQTKEGTPR